MQGQDGRSSKTGGTFTLSVIPSGIGDPRPRRTPRTGRVPIALRQSHPRERPLSPGQHSHRPIRDWDLGPICVKKRENVCARNATAVNIEQCKKGPQRRLILRPCVYPPSLSSPGSSSSLGGPSTSSIPGSGFR